MSDLYEKASILATMLKTQGRETWAQQIDDAISGGATATEILMRLRHVLQQIVPDLSSESELHSNLRTLIADINTLLR